MAAEALARCATLAEGGDLERPANYHEAHAVLASRLACDRTPMSLANPKRT